MRGGSSRDGSIQQSIIIQLVSHSDIRTTINEVLSSVPLETQATYNKQQVPWQECVPPYVVDQRAYMNHTRGKNKGLPRDPNPSVITAGERMAVSRGKQKVINAIVSVGSLEQQRLILLQTLSDPSIRDISSSIGINMSEIKVGQQLLRSARKLIRRSSNSPDVNGGRYPTSIAKRSVVKSLCVSILPTPTKEPSCDGTFMYSNHQGISMREITKQLGFSVGSGLRNLAVAQKKRFDIADGDKDGWIMLADDELRSKYTDELLYTLEYWMLDGE